MSVPCDMLLHPELLSNDQLINIIQQRHLHIPNVERMQRDELLELFHNFCVPYGQRKYKDTGRGKLLNQTRNMCSEPPVKLNVFNDSQSRKIPYPERCDRLKPPPDLLSGHLKRIKLDIRPVSDVNNSKRKMSIDSATPATDSPPPKKEKKAITWP
ncbi:unnamed protein product [Chilo suppressalis]|uniref:Ashwin n=1 Tax=Chilo suppressalis TaxID=168631 RepID=A0ABN8AZU4_CHISP|nr:hypothetical protein evm_006460 [Chilo suppressalis]CAH0399677.1 unnamed protein product [Chilo suppressalis]